MSRPLLSVSVQVLHGYSNRVVSSVTATTPGPVVGNQQHISKVIADALRNAADTIALGAIEGAYQTNDMYCARLEVQTNISANNW